MMDDKRRIALVLTAEALAVLDRNTSERKRGDFVSRMLVEWEARQGEVDRTGILERIEARLERMEKLMRTGGAS